MNQRLPNILLAGTPKSGTSSVYDWLVAHPEVSGGVKKEIFYLVDKDCSKYNKSSNWNEQGEEGYSLLFKGNEKWLVDGTTLTAYQKCAEEYIEKHKPLVIVFLRKQSDRIYSTYDYFKNTRSVIPESVSFYEFIKNQNKNVYENEQLNLALDHSEYDKYLDNLSSITDDLMVFTFDEMKATPKKVMCAICDRLDIDSSFYDGFEFGISNETYYIRSRWFNNLKENTSHLFPERAKLIIRGGVKKINSRNKGDKTEKEECKELLVKLDDRYIECNKVLSAKYGLDVKGWN